VPTLPIASLQVVNFIDNLFWSQRQLFKQDGLHPNKCCLLKDNVNFSFHHPSAVCANPLNLNVTLTPGQSVKKINKTSPHITASGNTRAKAPLTRRYYSLQLPRFSASPRNWRNWCMLELNYPSPLLQAPRYQPKRGDHQSL